MADNTYPGISFTRLARAAKSGMIDRRTTGEWSKLLGVSRQRLHQIRSVLGLPSRQAMVYRAVTARLSWKARAQALWRLGIYDHRGDCWKSLRESLCSRERFNSRSTGVKGSRRKVLHRLRCGYPQRNACFDLPSCGHPWCINPEHQRLIGFGNLTHVRGLPRAERVAAALEAGLSFAEIARREGIHYRYVSQINIGLRMRGVRDKYPIRAVRRRRQPKLGIRDNGKTTLGRK
jgi:hypothetical protein